MIKEILNNLKKIADNKVFAICVSQEELDKLPKYTANFLSINDKQAKILLDYITGLQEENKKLKDKVLELSNHLSLYSSEETLLSRINKAIEYNNHLIEHAKYHLNVNHIKKSNKILKGE